MCVCVCVSERESAFFIIYLIHYLILNLNPIGFLSGEI